MESRTGENLDPKKNCFAPRKDRRRIIGYTRFRDDRKLKNSRQPEGGEQLSALSALDTQHRLWETPQVRDARSFKAPASISLAPNFKN
jgi:hypothetical protein